MNNSTIFVAVRKGTSAVMSGVKGQYAFGNKASLGRSLGQAYGYEAKQKGVKTSALYSILEIDVATLLPDPSAE